MGRTEYTVQCFLSGEPIDVLPSEAIKMMSVRLSGVVSAYVRAHPRECEGYKESLKRKNEAAGIRACPTAGTSEV